MTTTYILDDEAEQALKTLYTYHHVRYNEDEWGHLFSLFHDQYCPIVAAGVCKTETAERFWETITPKRRISKEELVLIRQKIDNILCSTTSI